MIINNKITSFQYGVLGLMMGNALFLGFGIIILITLSKQDAWISTLMAAVLAIIPLIFMIILNNYLPDKNIFEKTKIMFGKIFGNIINMVLVLYMAFMVVLVLWTATYFSLTQYLTEVPYIFVAAVYILTATYGAIKGIEAIARTNEITFIIVLLFSAVVWLALYPNFQFEQLKPMLINGVKPLIGNAFIGLSYAFPPLITLLVIPKNDIINNKNYKRSLIIGFVTSLVIMAMNFFIMIGVITIDLAELFRYPAYFSQYKIDIAGFFQGVENFLSLHWILSAFAMLMMGMYFINCYVKNTFKIRKEKIFKIIIVMVAIVLVFVSNKIFSNSSMGVEFMKSVYPYYVALPMVAIIVILCGWSFIHRLRKKYSN